jgi:hypothetical protein
MLCWLRRSWSRRSESSALSAAIAFRCDSTSSRALSRARSALAEP